jgi:hypothetical protein
MQGHLDRQQQNLRSTKTTATSSGNNISAPGPAILDGIQTHHVHIVITDMPKGQVYTNQTGLFPIVSNRGTKAVIIIYDHDLSAILS